MEANLTNDNLKYYSFKGYSLFMLSKSHQVASGILAGIKSMLTVDFHIVKNMESSFDKSEVFEINVWKIQRRFKIFVIYSPPNNKPDFSFFNSSSNTIFLGDFNAHSPAWGYNKSNEAGKSVEDLLNLFIIATTPTHTFTVMELLSLQIFC